MKQLFSLILFVCALCGRAQENYQLLGHLPYPTQCFTTDNSGNVYVNAKNELIKFNREGKELYRYSNKSLGSSACPDATNMLRILMYYPEFTQAVFLDNTLSLSGEPVAFDKLGYTSVSLTCTSHNNGMWIFDASNSALYQLSANYEVLHQNTNLNAVLNTNLDPKEMAEYDNRLLLNNPGTGILVFDIYGTYYRTFGGPGIEHFQAFGDWLYFLKNGKMSAVNMVTTEEKEFRAPVQGITAFRIELNTLVVQSSDGISIYSSK